MKKVLTTFVTLVFFTIAAMPAFATHSGLNRFMTIKNNTHDTMVRFHASNRNQAGWQEDILGSDVLSPNQSVRVNVDDGTGYCIYDFKAVFDDGESVTRYGVNVCEAASWTIR